MRRKLFYWLVRDVFNLAVGVVLPKPLQILRAILFPLETLCCRNQNINYDPQTDTFVIYSIRYSGELFHDWSQNGLPIGTKFEIAKRENGVVCLNKIE